MAMLDVFARCSQEVLNTIEGERQNLQKIAEKKAGPIVKSARDHLQKQFNLELEIPPYTPPPLTLREFKFQARKIEHVKPGGMKTEVRYERVWWFPFWKRRLEVQVREPDTTTAEYQVDLQKLADAMTKTTQAALGHFRDAINGFVEKELGTSLQKYLESLHKIISSYVANLRAARTQQGLDARTRERLSKDLRALVTGCEAELQKCALYANLAKNVRIDTA